MSEYDLEKTVKALHDRWVVLDETASKLESRAAHTRRLANAAGAVWRERLNVLNAKKARDAEVAL